MTRQHVQWTDVRKASCGHPLWGAPPENFLVDAEFDPETGEWTFSERSLMDLAVKWNPVESTPEMVERAKREAKEKAALLSV